MQPRKIDLLLHCRWLIPVVPENQLLENYSVAIDAGRIASLLPTSNALESYSATKEIKLEQHVVMPGLINAHCQSSMRLLRNHPDYALANSALQHQTQLNLQAQKSCIVDAKFTQASSLLAMAEMIKTGTTCFADMCFPQDSHIDVVRQAGLRCQLSFMVCEHPTVFAQNAEQHIHKGLSLYDKIGEQNLIKVACSPQDLNNMSNSTLRQLSAYANELDLGLQVPCHTHVKEIDECQTKFGLRPLSRLDNMGLLSPQTGLIPTYPVDTEDMQLLKQTNANIICCPSASLGLSPQSNPIDDFQSASINTALGSGDIVSENSLDLMNEVKLCALMAAKNKISDRQSQANNALGLATINSAKALGWDQDIGSLEAGKFADIIAIEIDPIVQQPLYNPQQIVYSSTGTQVSHSWVAGKPVLEDKKLVNFNEQTLLQSAIDWQANLA